MSNRVSTFGFLFIVAAVVVGLPLALPAQQHGEAVQIAMPYNTSIVDGESLVIVTGRFAEQSELQCAPGFQYHHSTVIVDPGGGHGTQRTEILIFRTSQEPSRNGTRIRLLFPYGPCNADYGLYWGVVE